MDDRLFAAFEGFDPVPHHPWRQFAPSGRAVVASGGAMRAVSDQVYYLRGYGFDDAGFASIEGAVPRFATLQQRILTPSVQPGDAQWRYRAFTSADIESVRTPEFAHRFPDAPADPSAGTVDVSLEWWARPPASFRLRVPITDAVRKAERWQGWALLRSSVERARAAGVEARVDMPEPTLRESIHISERFTGRPAPAWREQTALGEGPLTFRGGYAHREPHDVQDVFAVNGIFDTTRLDWSRLAP